jgi:hypothetical protein
MWIKKRKQEQGNGKMGEQLARRLAGGLLSIQRRLADFVTNKCRRLSKRQSQWMLALFCVLFGGLSIRAFVKAFQPATLSKSLRPTPISIPPFNVETGAEQKESVVTPEDLLKIHRFRVYMDSLSNSENGCPLYDSILKARPNLLDSIRQIEQLYSSSSK